MSQENEYESEDDDIPELDSVSSSEVRRCICGIVFVPVHLLITHVIDRHALFPYSGAIKKCFVVSINLYTRYILTITPQVSFCLYTVYSFEVAKGHESTYTNASFPHIVKFICLKSNLHLVCNGRETRC